jgi:hypothetical protein
LRDISTPYELRVYVRPGFAGGIVLPFARSLCRSEDSGEQIDACFDRCANSRMSSGVMSCFALVRCAMDWNGPAPQSGTAARLSLDSTSRVHSCRTSAKNATAAHFDTVSDGTAAYGGAAALSRVSSDA